MSIQLETQDGTAVTYQSIGFSVGERHIQLQDLSILSVSGITIRARLTSSNDLMDLLLIESALRNALGHNLAINLELPYLPYARQDRVCAAGQAFSLEVMAKLLSTMNIHQLVTWDCHSKKSIELTGACNVKPATIINSDPALTRLLTDPQSVLICPDKGATARCQDIQQSLGIKEMVQCEKQRDPATGAIQNTDVLCGDLSGKCAIITDDICDGGYTFIKIAEQLREKNVERVVLFVTHGIFSKGLGVFSGLIDEVITSNSLNLVIPKRINPTFPTLRVINYQYTFGA